MADLYNSSGEIIRELFDISPYGLIHTFTPFETDYATESNTPKVLNIDTETFLDTFYNPYLGNNDNGVFVGKKEIGKDETGQYKVWQYELRPIDGDYKKTILLTSGMHTYELPASFGLARWVKEFMESKDAVFDYLRKNVRIFLIPIVNPWGFNQNPKKYGNSNGINPNRNFNDWQGAWESFPVSTDEWNQKGEAPFSEAETQNLRDWLYSHPEAEFWIDCHTGVECSNGEVWCLYTSSNPNVNKIQNAIEALSMHIQSTYGKTAKTYTQIDADSFIKGKFGTDVCGIPTMTIEQSSSTETAFKSVPNNCAEAITEYATQIHAYLMAQLM